MAKPLVETLLVSDGIRTAPLRIFDRRIGHFQMDWLLHHAGLNKSKPWSFRIQAFGSVAFKGPVMISAHSRVTPFVVVPMQ